MDYSHDVHWENANTLLIQASILEGMFRRCLHKDSKEAKMVKQAAKLVADAGELLHEKYREANKVEEKK